MCLVRDKVITNIKSITTYATALHINNIGRNLHISHNKTKFWLEQNLTTTIKFDLKVT